MPQPAQVSHMLEGRATLRGRNQSGQVIVLVVLGLAVLLGAAALVVDLGYAYSAQRNLQSSADSAALAGAQGLPNVGNVVQFAKQYGSQDKNTHAVSGNVDESITTTCVEGSAGCAPDAVVVSEIAHPRSFLARLFGVTGFTVSVKSAACLDTTSGQAILIGTSYHGTGCAIPATSNPGTGVDSNPPGGGGGNPPATSTTQTTTTPTTTTTPIATPTAPNVTASPRRQPIYPKSAMPATPHRIGKVAPPLLSDRMLSITTNENMASPVRTTISSFWCFRKIANGDFMQGSSRRVVGSPDARTGARTGAGSESGQGETLDRLRRVILSIAQSC